VVLVVLVVVEREVCPLQQLLPLPEQHLGVVVVVVQIQTHRHKAQQAAQESLSCVYPILLRRYSQVVSLLVLMM
jgi:hypothetical protein